MIQSRTYFSTGHPTQEHRPSQSVMPPTMTGVKASMNNGNNNNYSHGSQYNSNDSSLNQRMNKLSIASSNGITSSTNIIINGNCHSSQNHQMPSLGAHSFAQGVMPAMRLPQEALSNSVIIHHQRDFPNASNSSSGAVPVYSNQQHSFQGKHISSAPQLHANLPANQVHQQANHSSMAYLQQVNQVIHHPMQARSAPITVSANNNNNNNDQILYPLDIHLQHQRHLASHAHRQVPLENLRSHSQQLLFDHHNQYANQPTSGQQKSHYNVLREDQRTGKTIVVQEPLYSNQHPILTSSASTPSLVSSSQLHHHAVNQNGMRPPTSKATSTNQVIIHHQRDFANASHSSNAAPIPIFPSQHHHQQHIQHQQHLQQQHQLHQLQQQHHLAQQQLQLHAMHSKSVHPNFLPNHQSHQQINNSMVYPKQANQQQVQHQLPSRSIPLNNNNQTIMHSRDMHIQHQQRQVSHHQVSAQSHDRSHSQQLLLEQQNYYANQPTTQPGQQQPRHYFVLEEDYLRQRRHLHL